MDDTKLFAKNKNGLETRVLGWKKTNEGWELPNQERIWRLEENETYKYFEILEVNTIKHVEMKGKKEECLRRREKLLKINSAEGTLKGETPGLSYL